MPENRKADQKRDEELHNLGIKILRYTNLEVNNSFNAVCEDILKSIGLDFGDLKK
jgi:very-short-patch-repair endonuclease